MTVSSRTAVLNELASIIEDRDLPRPLRIAIDGRTASGKTTLADELAAILKEKGREVIRTSLDGFHRPKIERYARGRHSAEGYYYDARDLAAINRLLLEPLGPNGSLRYRTASFDLENDKPLDQEEKTAPASAVLIVDGTFLQRPELRDGWDLAIFVETSEAVSERRGIDRDTERLGGSDAAGQLYELRYRPAFEIYESICDPIGDADIVINNEVFSHPVLSVRGEGKSRRKA